PRALPLPGAEVDAPDDDGPTGPVSAGPPRRSTGVAAPWRACVAHTVVLSRGGESLHRFSRAEWTHLRAGPKEGSRPNVMAQEAKGLRKDSLGLRSGNKFAQAGSSLPCSAAKRKFV